MEFRNLFLYMLIFALGAVSISLVYEVSSVVSERPLDVIKNPVDSLSETLSAATSGRGIERTSPADHIAESQIKVYNNKIELDIQNAIWSKFTNTNSMDPFLDEGSNGIEIIPTSESQIEVGDIISYESKAGGIIVHRVIKIEQDEEGTYFIVKGDNNPIQDPEQVRFSQVKGIVVGIIY
jgi:hypothetical protein